MQLQFHKYQGTGNDFILVDGRTADYKSYLTVERVSQWCHRRFGIGADGLILLQEHATCDFEMVYFNADGKEGSMCGNGGRCIVAFAHRLGIIDQSTQFMAIDGIHHATIRDNGWIELEMQPVSDIDINGEAYFLDTGSPHYVTFVPSIDGIDIVQEGRKIRYSDRFAKVGTNVNYVESLMDRIRVATYERGVEDETLSCGTGVTASAIASCSRNGWVAGNYVVKVETKGGNLEVRFVVADKSGPSAIWLCGPAMQVFTGAIQV